MILFITISRRHFSRVHVRKFIFKTADIFFNRNMLYSGMGGRKGRDGLFPATSCIKISGYFGKMGISSQLEYKNFVHLFFLSFCERTTDDTKETISVRGCALDSGIHDVMIKYIKNWNLFFAILISLNVKTSLSSTLIQKGTLTTDTGKKENHNWLFSFSSIIEPFPCYQPQKSSGWVTVVNFITMTGERTKSLLCENMKIDFLSSRYVHGCLQSCSKYHLWQRLRLWCSNYVSTDDADGCNRASLDSQRDFIVLTIPVFVLLVRYFNSCW